MSTFWRLFEESVIVQSLITLALVLAVIYLVATGQAVPDILSSALMLVLGFYFGSKSEQQIHTALGAKRQREDMRNA